MTLNELNTYISSYLKIQDFPNDSSLNGVQVQNSEPDTKQITKIAFAVDACRGLCQIKRIIFCISFTANIGS